MAKALTARAVETFKPDPDKRTEIPDPALSGLYLVVQPSGAKSWALRYRFAGKPKKLTLGKWPLLGVADARTAATEAVQEIEHGRDPGAAKQRARAERLEAQLTERDKIKTLLEQYDKRHLVKLKSRKTVKRELDRFVVENWGDRDIHEIGKRDVVDLLEEIADSGRVVTANRVRAYCSLLVGSFDVNVYGNGIAEVRTSTRQPHSEYIGLCAAVFAGISGSDLGFSREAVAGAFNQAGQVGRFERDIAGVEIKVSPDLSNLLACRFYKY